MSGHSKWSTIKRHKAKMDAARSNVISKALREVMLAAREGGPNPDGNVRLKIAIERAKNANVSTDSVTRAIKRGAGQGDSGPLEELVYECYGPGGTAVLVEAATDNRNRTASEVRYILSKNGGKLADLGAVAWMFDVKGCIQIEKGDLSEDDALEMAIDAGAEDIKTEEEAYEIYTGAEDLQTVQENLEKAGATILSADTVRIPKTTVTLEGEETARMLRLIDALEEHDDVSRVYANFDISDEIMEAMSE
ncbi:MAG: YebC/PmpR family DNA-binding transcriptional regulator [Bacillota bacterium]|jgi:YebC/PmpR family DNA-binding regulatory protein